MPDFNKAAVEILKVLQSFNYPVMLYGDDSERVQEPSEARIFYAPKANLRVSLIDDGDDSSLKLTLSKSVDINQVFTLDQTLRTLATKYALNFEVRKYGQEITPMDITGMAESAERAKPVNILEGMYGTSRSSYLRMENARMIVRHNGRIDDSKPGARGRCVESILIENNRGERFLFPTRHLAPARAMTQHINMGGEFADPAGTRISEMATDYAHLAKASHHIAAHSGALAESAGDLRESVRGKMREMRRVFERLCRPSLYETEIATLQEPLTEDSGDEAMLAEHLATVQSLMTVEGVDLDEAIYECVSRRLGSTLDEERYRGGRPKGEDLTSPRVSIIGKPVRKAVWEKFKDGEMELTAEPDTRHRPETPEEMIHALRALATITADDTLSNLFSAIAESYPDQPEDQKRIMAAVARKACKIAGLIGTQGLATKNEVVKEYGSWIRQFRTDRILREFSAGDAMWDSEPQDDYAETRAVQEFDPTQFLASSYAADLNTHDPMQVHQAIGEYLQHWMETNCAHVALNTDHLVDAVMPQVLDSLPHDDIETEADVPGDLPMLDDAPEDGDPLGDDDDAPEGADETGPLALLDWATGGPSVLSREDVLLPSGNEDDSLKREVTKATVRDPVDGHEETPTPGYIQRLTTLAGMHNRQRS